MKMDKIKTHKNVIHKTSFIQFLINKKAERLKAMAKYMRKRNILSAELKSFAKLGLGCMGSLSLRAPSNPCE